MVLNARENNDPMERALSLKKTGMTDQEISNSLRNERYNSNQISNAMDQAIVKNEINPDEVPSPSDIPAGEPNKAVEETAAPQIQQPAQTFMPTQSRMPTFAPEPANRQNYEMVEQIAESIVSEKWNEMVRDVGDLRMWKEKVETDMAGVKQEILRVQARFENLQKAVLGKVSEYSQGITDLNAEIKAMEKVFERILGPLTRSVKDLEKVTEKIKK